MISKIKRTKQLIFILLFLFTIIFSYGQDTTVRRRYLDSIKNQLALHATGYYTYLNLYDRSENERRKIHITLQATQNILTGVEEAWRKQNLLHGVVFVLIGIASIAAGVSESTVNKISRDTKKAQEMELKKKRGRIENVRRNPDLNK
jgi:hypothetical protein